MELDGQQLRQRLGFALAKLRLGRLSELAEKSLPGPEPVFALRVELDRGAIVVEVMDPDEYEADCSRAIVVRPFRWSPAVLSAAMEDASEVLRAAAPH